LSDLVEQELKKWIQDNINEETKSLTGDFSEWEKLSQRFLLRVFGERVREATVKDIIYKLQRCEYSPSKIDELTSELLGEKK